MLTSVSPAIVQSGLTHVLTNPQLVVSSLLTASKYTSRSKRYYYKTSNINNNNNNNRILIRTKNSNNVKQQKPSNNNIYKYNLSKDNEIDKLNYQTRTYSSSNKTNLMYKNDYDHQVVGYSLLPVINKLQENAALIGSEITLPQIVVIGSQSSGKSSVLENLVGRDFLPRGSGLVTRRPLILQLNKSEGQEEWGEFGHTGNIKFTFEGIKQEIEAETSRVAGPNKDISPEPIVLKIYSPNVVPLTLVDTPGITRVPIGDQALNIEEKIRTMITEYIQNPNCIILAVTSANQDIVTSDAIQMARNIDPLGQRTIGVLTKIDLMDKGTDALDILLGNTIPLKLGFVGVVNRSQSDINLNKPIHTMLKDEMKFFESHPVYNRILHQAGTKYLAQKCNKILTKHIRETFPLVKSQIKQLIKKYQQELEKYGDPIPERQVDKQRLLYQHLNKFATQFTQDLEGNDELNTDNINGGARIRYVFSKAFKANKEKPFEWLTDQQLRVALRNASGLRSTMFIPQKTFDSLIKSQIERLKEPALICSELVLDELLRILIHVESDTLARFPVLRDRIVEVSNNVLRKLLNPTNEMISSIVDAESNFINTSHPNYLVEMNKLMSAAANTNDHSYQYEQPKPAPPAQQSSGILSRIFGSGSKTTDKPHTTNPNNVHNNPHHKHHQKPQEMYGLDESMTEDERRQIHLLRNLLMAYYNIAQFNVQENTMKIINLSLIEKAKHVLQKELVSQLYDENLVEHLLRENELVMAKRNECIYKLEILKKAKKSLSAEVKELPLNLY
ncbi:hypothetical protein CYY_003313 [Polysphondylium violaceum]|uniref:Uncharacterized protein n=1 Tax=Polysphondylium violaceum TaxID=133409 RepID=A0A8J4V8T6_9MYCE|nr:hypothetical protein CYY_003313 [Polysphondylium violaceum]